MDFAGVGVQPNQRVVWMEETSNAGNSDCCLALHHNSPVSTFINKYACSPFARTADSGV